MVIKQPFLTKTLGSRQQMRKQKFRQVQTLTHDHMGSSRAKSQT